MTAEDARRNVEALSQLLRDEVAEAMSDAPRTTVGTTERPVWLTTGEEQLTRALRSSRPGDFSANDFSTKSSALSLFGSRTTGTRLRSWVLAALVVAGVGLGAGLAAWQSETTTDVPALAFRTEEDPPSRLRRSGRVIAPADRAEEVRFSDGSRLSLSAGSMLRVRETDAHGAMVIVEEGQVESNIQHTGSARWSVFAGPYEVRVVGTRFATTWDPARQRLAVVLHQGSVQVLGKGIDELVELKPGQRFDSAGADGKWFVTATIDRDDQGGSDAPTDASVTDLSGADLSGGLPRAAVDPSAASPNGGGERAASDVRSNGSRAGSVEAAPAGASWSTLVANGRFEEVLEEAGIRGEAACLRSCSIADLRALADAARYTGRFSLAERTLSQLRSTAPSEAPRAGFLLGSMNEAQGRSAAALEWYGRYLAEAPGGGLVAEARAGRMRALLALGQTEAAKAAARDYLRMHPAGVGAATARQILLRP